MTLPLRKYACNLTLDPNTAHTCLSLSEGNRKVENVGEDQPYLHHPDRFDYWPQVLSVESLSGRCYWEVEWRGRAEIAASYRRISRTGGSDCLFGLNDQSWRLYCSSDGFSVCHNNMITAISNPSPDSSRIGVYLDWASGSLSFYSIFPETHPLTRLYTFSAKFSEPLYAGFRVYNGSSVRVCEIK